MNAISRMRTLGTLCDRRSLWAAFDGIMKEVDEGAYNERASVPADHLLLDKKTVTVPGEPVHSRCATFSPATGNSFMSSASSHRARSASSSVMATRRRNTSSTARPTEKGSEARSAARTWTCVGARTWTCVGSWCGDDEVRWPGDDFQEPQAQARLGEGDELDVEVTAGGILRPCSQRDEDQWWYWTDEWQAGEQQISEGRAAGRRGPVFASGDELLAALRHLPTTDGPGDNSSR